jgi:hypothetical protein
VLRGSSRIAALVLCASTVSPADAKSRETPPGSRAPALIGIGLVAPEREARPAERPRLRFANESIIRQDGSPGARHSIVGSWPVLGPLAAEVGLFSVAGAKSGERELKRTDPLADVRPRSSRVAAVGLRMRF